MAIHRTDKTGNYTRIDNKVLRSKTLSLSARAVLAVLLSLWDDYDFSIEHLAKLCNVGQDAIRSALRELEKAGYLTRKRIRISGQYRGATYEIYEDPSLNPTFTPPASGKPTQAKPAREKPRNDIYNININSIHHKDHSVNQDRPTEDQIKAQIAFDVLCKSYDRRLLEDIVRIMADMMTVQTDTIEVRKGTAYPADYVRSCLSKITAHHIEQIMNTLERVNPTVQNMRSYLLSTLLNSTNTMSMSWQYGDC